jgi:hypothetical protein
MRKWSKAWAAQLTLVLVLALGVGAAVVWLMPSEALRAARQVSEMKMDQAIEVLEAWPGGRPTLVIIEPIKDGGQSVFPVGLEHWTFADGSTLKLVPEEQSRRVISVSTTPPDPPLSCLRRILARLIPALKG